MIRLLHFFVRRMLPATPTELFDLQTVRSRLPVLRRRIIALFAVTALQRDDFPWHCLLLATSNSLLNDLRDGACPHGVAAFANRETQALLHGHRRNQLDH